ICGGKRIPAKRPYQRCFTAVAGEVIGSVSMTKARKRSDDCNASCDRPAVGLLPPKRLSRMDEIKAAVTKLMIIWKRLILRISIRPPTATNGAITALPTHQLAASPAPKAVSTTAIAAGLKMFCLRITNRYFDAIARPPAAVRKTRFWIVKIGVIINAKIKPVISGD